ncbi:MAG: carbohydrate kinase family protein [Chloroflexi bacterium]|nr:carbohydrate kinase family protein [Chloroflexota bacterium]
MAAELVAFGDISMDVAVEIPRLPGPDEKLWVEIVGEYPGGMGANAAAAFAALGGRAALVASVGDDERGTRALAELTERGVDLAGVAHLDAATFWTLALLAERGEKSLLQFATPALRVPWASVDWSILDGAMFAHTIADEGDGNLRLIAEARQRGVMVSVDIEPVTLEAEMRDQLLRGAQVVFTTPAALQSLGAPRGPEVGAAWLIERGPRIVVVTLGHDGCFVATSSAEAAQIAGIDVEARDTTGAGDCFAGAFLWALSRRRSALEAGRLANSMAALSTSALGSRGNLVGLAELAGRQELAGLGVEGWGG